MLKNYFLPENYTKRIFQICGEIVCENFEEFVINCKLCKIKIFEFEEFKQHFKNVHLEDSPPVNEPEDLVTNRKQHYQANNKNNYKRSINMEITLAVEKNVKGTIKHTDIVNNEETLWESDKDFNMKSTECNSQGDDSKSITKKPRKPEEFGCEICNKKYNKSRHLQLHLTIAHLLMERHKCSKCKLIFVNKRSLNNHIFEKHTRGLDCPECYKTLSSRSTLKRHMFVHANKKEFICPEKDCGKGFASRVQLKRHERLHTDELFICEECGYKCRYRESLVVHKRRHTGENPFGCKLCDRHFGSKSLLNEHMASHETDRRHVCDVCGKSFNRPKALYHHKHLHMGIKKFVCKTCGQAYAQVAGLSAHLRKHREEVKSPFSPEDFMIFQ